MPQTDRRTQQTIHTQDHNPAIAFDDCSDPNCASESKRLRRYTLAAQRVSNAAEEILNIARKLVQETTAVDVITGTIGHTKELKEALEKYDEAWRAQWDLMNPSAAAMRETDKTKDARHTKSR
jgi:hypothetical protein